MNSPLEAPQRSFPDQNTLPEEVGTLYDVQIEGKKKSYSCRIPDCGKLFRYKSEIHRHIATHSNHRPHICPYDACKKSFKRGDALENHLRTHTKETPFVCQMQECGQTFTTKASLRYHILKHKNQKIFKCSFIGCNKAFITIFQLKQHEKSACVHKKLPLDSQSTNTMTTPENLDVSKIQAQTQDSKIEIPPFLKNLPIDYLNIPKQRPQDERQGVMEDKIMNILSENQVLKKRLELSQKIIGLLQQKIQYEPVAIPDYPPPELFPESLMRFQFYNNPDN